MKNLVKEIEQHRKEMTTQKSATSERQSEHTSFRQTKLTFFRQTEPTYSRKTEVTSSSNKTFSRKKEMKMIDKLTKFKKFAPPTFKEARTPAEAEEWLNQLEIILEVLKTEEEDKIPFTKFLLRGEAREWWKIEKSSCKGAKIS